MASGEPPEVHPALAGGLPLDAGDWIEVPPNARVRATGPYLPVQDRLLPSALDVEFGGDAERPTFIGRVELRDGTPRVVRWAFESREGEGEVRQSHLRESRVDAVLTLLAGFSLRITFDDDREPHKARVELGLDALDEVSAMLKQTRSNRRVTPALLRQVAAVYKANIDTGPTQAVKKQFFVSERMAGNYVRRAREAGYLPHTTPGRKRAE